MTVTFCFDLFWSFRSPYCYLALDRILAMHRDLGAQVNVLIFIVIIIGGLGSTGGALIGALLVGLMANYTGFLVPKVALFSNIALMVAILLWRPQGIYPVANR